MVKEIKYKGVTANPSDYDCPDGELTEAINLIPEDGVLKPVLEPKSDFKLPSQYTFVGVHQTSDYVHFICLGPITYAGTWVTKSLYWIDSSKVTGGTDVIESDFTRIRHTYYGADLNIPPSVKSCSSLGNILVVTMDGEDMGLNFMKWNTSSDNYDYLGSQLPEVVLSFGLQGKAEWTSNFTAYMPSDGSSFREHVIPESWKTPLTDSVMGVVNREVNNALSAGYFTQPFFVRYALRFFDGSHSRPSAPILMNPCTYASNPMVVRREVTVHGDGAATLTLQAMVVKASLDVRFVTDLSDSTSTLEKWKDIVSGVDIFVSQQIPPYDQDGKISTQLLQETKIMHSCFIGKFDNAPDATSKSKYMQWDYVDIYGCVNDYYRDSPEHVVPTGGYALPPLSEDTYYERLTQTSRFYLLTTIDIDDIADYTSRTKITIPSDYLSNLAAKTEMHDDEQGFQSNDDLLPANMYMYNNRLSISDITRRLYKGYYVSQMLAYCKDRYNKTSNPDGSVTINVVNDYNDKYNVIVYLRIDGREYKVYRDGSYDLYLQNLLSDSSSASTTSMGYDATRKDSYGCYFFYPNEHAYKMDIICQGMNLRSHSYGSTLSVDLEPHPFLSGAYGYIKFYRDRNSAGATSFNDQDSPEIRNPNELFTSLPDNPFVFAAKTAITVSLGTILATHAVLRPLSQGQFGDYPLYGFASDGVYALIMNDSGVITKKVPVSNDVCTNPVAITSTDTEVVYSTEQGLKLLSGLNAVCISDIIDNIEAFKLSDLSGGEQLITLANLSGNQCDVLPLRNSLPGSLIAYDYIHQRIYLFPASPDPTCAYVYSLRSKAWGMASRAWVYTFKNAPDTFVLKADGSTLSIASENYISASTDALLVTRPIKLDEPDTLKTIDTVIQRGQFRKGHVKSALYGSRDLYNWHLVASSNDHILRGFRGTPYKYFRIVLVCNLDKNESISGCTIHYTPRLINKLR